MRRSNRARIALLVAPTALSIAPGVANALWPEIAGEVVRGDFDNDGELEVVVSSPEDDCSKGRVYVVEPSTGSVIHWTRDTSGVLGTATCGDLFGMALAVGDFDGDTYDDLAVGAPGADDSGVTDAGAVHVLYGSSSGLTATGDQLWHQDSTGISGEAETEDDFGSVLTTADFDCDGYSDIVASVPLEDVSVPEAGAVHVLYGSSGGVSNVNDFYRQGVGGVGGLSEEGDHFGASLVAGNYNGDQSSGRDCDDLTIGAPDEEIDTVVAAGRTWTFYGGASGLSTTGSLGLHQNVSGVVDICETSDRFSERLLNGDVNADGYDDLAVTVPADSCLNGHGAGRHVFLGGSSGLTTNGDYLECDVYRCLINDDDEEYGCPSYAEPVHASAGSDTIEMFVGNDVVWGRAGADIVAGGHGDDVLLGGDGNDRLDGGAGLDVQIGGAGNDVFVVDLDCDVLEGEVIDGGPGTDKIESHLTQAQLGSLGLVMRSIETFTTIAEGEGSCSPFPFEEGPFVRPKVAITWDDLPDADSSWSTRQGLVDLSIENVTAADVDVQLRVLLHVRGYVVPLHPAPISITGLDTEPYTLDLSDFIPTGVDPQSIPPELMDLPSSATILVHARVTIDGEYAGTASAPPIYGHYDGLDVQLYRAGVLYDTYRGGNLVAPLSSGPPPAQRVRVQIAATVPDP